MGPSSPRTAWRYALFQLPAAALVLLLLWAGRRWLGYSAWIVWGGLAAWLAKDAALYPLVWRSYAREPGDADAMAGARGVAEGDLSPRGHVRVGAERWRAEAAEDLAPIPRGSSVRVRARRGLTLVVEPDREGGEARGTAPPRERAPRTGSPERAPLGQGRADPPGS